MTPADTPPVAPLSARADQERAGLRVSIVTTVALGCLGVVWGVASGSQMILLDGVYAFVGVAVSFLLLWASNLAAEGPTRRYPFGREATTPLAIGIQGFVLLVTLAYAAFEAALVLRKGGSELTAGPALAYAVVATVGALVVWAWLGRRAHVSDLLVSEATAWKVAAWRGVGMMAGFSLMWLLEGSSRSWLAPFVDPGMVLVTCMVFAPAPLGMIRQTLVELQEGAPPAPLRAEAMARIGAVVDEFGLPEPLVRMAKVGPKLYVEIDIVVSAEVTVGQEDRVRRAIRTRLADLPYDLWISVELSADPSWGR